MPNPFAITAASNTVLLDDKRQGQTSFTVTNISGRALRGRAKVVPTDAAAASWLKIDGEAEQDFAIAETKQHTVKITVPAKAPAGGQSFRLDMVGVDNPDEEFTEGPSVTFQVPAPIIKGGGIPWLIIAAIVGVLVVVIGIFVLLRSQADGRQSAAAQTATAVAVATQGAANAATQTAAVQAAATNAIATERASITQTASAQTAVANATATAHAIATGTAVAQAAAATATAQAMANATATQTTLTQYNGCWVPVNSNSKGLTILRIANSGTTITAQGSYPCTPNCTNKAGSGSIGYHGPPLNLPLITGDGLAHLLKLTRVGDQLRDVETGPMAGTYDFKRGTVFLCLDIQAIPIAPINPNFVIPVGTP
ncbi:MAG: hypothetical protein HY326_10350 [Chloroflexi bacterium]|nr:hypothetical protein [Chloroflexota bacterium]